LVFVQLSTDDFLNCNIRVTSAKIISAIVLSPFNLNFRLHTWLSREPWAKLWYCVRALDKPKRGYYEIPIELAEVLTGGDEKTIYRWLRDGKLAGAFRRYKIRRRVLSVWLGGLFAVCQKMNLANWGAVAVVNLLDISTKIRALTTATATQKLQQGSRYAANRRLKKEYRLLFGAPHPNQLVKDKRPPSLKSEKGEIPPFVIYTSETRIFVSKSFTAFGISQHSISCDLGIHIRTVQRHQAAIGMDRRQLCQGKSEYGQLKRSIEEESSESWAWTDGVQNKNLGYQSTSETITFFDGLTPGAKKARANQWRMSAGDLDRRLFAIGRKQKRYFLAKCNIYREKLDLTSMRASRKAFRLRLDKLAQDNVTVSEVEPPSPQVAVVTQSCIPPGNERHF
jgi:hypothetical protein